MEASSAQTSECVPQTYWPQCGLAPASVLCGSESHWATAQGGWGCLVFPGGGLTGTPVCGGIGGWVGRDDHVYPTPPCHAGQEIWVAVWHEQEKHKCSLNASKASTAPRRKPSLLTFQSPSPTCSYSALPPLFPSPLALVHTPTPAMPHTLHCLLWAMLAHSQACALAVPSA